MEYFIAYGLLAAFLVFVGVKVLGPKRRGTGTGTGMPSDNSNDVHKK